MPAAGETRAGSVAPVVGVVVAAHLLYAGARLALVGDLVSFADGYDGLAYRRLALDPLTLAVTDHGTTFTRPAYWQARIGYPAAAWALSLGRDDLVPAALVLVNLLAVAGIALLAARLARGLDRSPWWGAVPALWAGFLVGLGQDLTEPLAGVLLLSALALLRSRRPALAALALTAAALTRETTLVVAVAVLLAGVLPRRTGGPPAWVGAVPLATYAAWRAWVRDRWSGAMPDPPSDNPLGVPLVELTRYLGSAARQPVAEVPQTLLLVLTLVAVGLAATALRVEAPRHERLALAAYLLVLASLPVWDRGQAYLRWGCEPVLLGWLLLVGSVRPYAVRARRALVPLVVVVWLVTASQSVAYPHGGGWWGWS